MKSIPLIQAVEALRLAGSTKLTSRFRRFWRNSYGGFSLAVVAASGAMAATASGQTLYFLTTDGKLATALAASPGTNTDPLTILNITAGETLVAIDVRPQNQKLYALGVNATANTATLYQISPDPAPNAPPGTVFAGVVGTASSVAFTTDGATPVAFPDVAAVPWDIDFNPAVDRLRIVAGSLNFRINPNTGLPVDGDNTGLTSGTIAGTNPDGPINGLTTTVGAVAYTNSQPNNGNLTTLYTLDSATNSLYIQNPANVGTQTMAQTVTLGGATLDFSQAAFDIAPFVNVATSNTAVTAGSGLMVANVGGTNGVYSLNLVNGQATLLGTTALTLRSAAIRTELGAALTFDGANLVRFNPATPGTTTSVALTGLTAGEVLVGFDGRPQTGQLYGLGINSTADTGTLYLIDPQTGAATAVGTPGQVAFAGVDFPDASAGYGFDFNPTVDRVRVVTGSGLNFRLNPNTGAPAAATPDGALNGGGASATATAYTNSFAQSLIGGVTTQYAFDSAANILYIQNPPNNGNLTVPVTVTGVTGGAINGFDIPSPVAISTSNTPSTGHGWIISGGTGAGALYRVNLGTGATTSFGTVGSGLTTTGLVLWASVPDVSVEQPAGTAINSGATVSFGAQAGGPGATQTFTLLNSGSQTLTYTATLAGSTAFEITPSPSGSVPGSGSATFVVEYSPSAVGTETDTLTITSNDPDSPAFTVNLTGTGFLAATNDRVTVTTGETRFSPLSNDTLAGDLEIAEVSNGLIQIADDGRTLIIPNGFTGTFTYLVTNGTLTAQGSVTVAAGTVIATPTTFNGLLYSGDDEIAGWANATVTSTGLATVQIRGGTILVKTKINAPTVGTPASAYTSLGNVTLTRNANGTVSLALDALGGDIGGVLRAAVTSTTAAKHHIALASISSTIPGGGYAIATISNKGAVKVTGVLPDGLPFSAATTYRDNGSYAFFTAVTKGPKPPAFLTGELLSADLTLTDVTGDLAYLKFPQAAGAKGTHLDGIDTILTANGSLYTGAALFSGSGTLALSGGNLAGFEINPVAITSGIPEVPTGSLVGWTGVKAKVGKFSAKVTVPTVTKPVKGSGIYLPKSATAWGYFPGTTVGGRIILSVPQI